MNTNKMKTFKMKTLLLIISLILVSFVSQAQVKAYTVQGTTSVTADSLLIINGDTITHFYTINPNDTVVSKSYIDGLFQTIIEVKQDTLSFFELEIPTNGDTDHTVPFTLRPTAYVWYNGALIKQDDWDGAETNMILLNFDVKQYDLLKIQN